jgi:integrase
MTKSRSRGNRDGSFYQRKNGLWVGGAWVRTPEGGERRKYVTSMDRAVAHRKWTELMQQAAKGPVAIGTSTLADYLDYWLADVVRPFRRANTYDSYETMVRLHITPYLGRKRLDRLSVADVRQWLRDLKEAGASARTVQLSRAVLRSSLTNAMTEELVSRNVAALVSVPRPPRRRVVPWTVTEARDFLNGTRTHRFYLAYVLITMLGLRRGEALGVGWDDIDFDKGEIHIRWQIQRDRQTRQLVRVPVKTDGSEAVIPLPTPVVAVLLDRQAAQDLERSVRRHWINWENANLVLTTLDGYPIDPRNFNRAFDASCAKVNARVIRVHDIRHTCASLLRSFGVDLSVIKEILRHAQLSITADIYVHVTTDDQRDALRMISDALDPLPDS